jgi:hypothetical protein
MIGQGLQTPCRSIMIPFWCLLAMLFAPTSNAQPLQENHRWPDYHSVLKPYVDKAEWLPQEVAGDPQARQDLNVFMTTPHAMSYFSNVYQDTRYPDF